MGNRLWLHDCTGTRGADRELMGLRSRQEGYKASCRSDATWFISRSTKISLITLNKAMVSTGVKVLTVEKTRLASQHIQAW